MAQLVSSLKNYVVDLWRRCFAKEYLVKAEGNSEAMHDFRRCPRCGKHIKSIDLEWNEDKCKKCKSIILKDGIYLDKKERSFRLAKPLYSKIGAMLLLLWIVNLIAVMCIFRVRHVPSMYAGVSPSSYFMLMYFFAVLSCCMFVVRKLNNLEFIGFIVPFCGVFCGAGLIFLAMFPIRGFYITPFWTTIPTQQAVYDEQVSTLGKMPLTTERYEYALKIAENPKVIVQQELINVATSNFAGLMNSHPDAVHRFNPGSIRERQFYELYRNYLESLHKDDREIQCNTDSWNLATAQTMQQYPDVWEMCKQ
ncbi:MAG: hypothetical protein WC819_03475 [Parcubacteria group bacterium]|jgi:hypothetical protein